MIIMTYQDSYDKGNQQNQSTASGSMPTSTTELRPNSRGLPTVEGLSNVLQHTQHLLGEHAVPAISVSITL